MKVGWDKLSCLPRPLLSELYVRNRDLVSISLYSI